MILGVSLPVLLVVALAVLVGAVAQSLVGLGLALVSAPVVTLVEPRLMPELVLALAILLPLLTLLHSRRGIDWPGLGWVLGARVPGVAVGVLLLAAFSDRSLGVAVGVMVLLAVAASLGTWELRASRPTLATAGFLSGVAGTTTSIGGPPVALVYQRRPPEQLRSTLAVFFAAGAALSLAGLGLAGRLHPGSLLLSVVLLPVLLLGQVLGVRLQGHLAPGLTRYAVLALCAASALTLLVRSLA